MAELGIFCALLFGAKKLVDRFVRHKVKTSTEDIADVERSRQRAITATVGRHRPLSRRELEYAAQRHAEAEEYRTGENPMIRRGYSFEDIVGPLTFLRDAGTPFYDQLSPMLSEFELESFTQSWNRRELADILAGGTDG